MILVYFNESLFGTKIVSDVKDVKHLNTKCICYNGKPMSAQKVLDKLSLNEIKNLNLKLGYYDSKNQMLYTL